jgi:hypothetical protein
MQDVGFHVVAAGGLALGCAIRVLVDVPLGEGVTLDVVAVALDVLDVVDVPTCFVPLAIFHFVVLLSVV